MMLAIQEKFLVWYTNNIDKIVPKRNSRECFVACVGD